MRRAGADRLRFTDLDLDPDLDADRFDDVIQRCRWPSFELVRYADYEASAGAPNVVVDGSPNSGTVLCLTHWPGFPCVEPSLAADLSAQMALRYVDRGMDLHGDAEIVTNNHFDQDGLTGVYALVAPEHALQHRHLLEDIAAAGDFATYRDRRAAQISAAISATALLTPGDPYPVGLEHLPRMIDDIGAYRELWADDDARLTGSERAIDGGVVKIEEESELDLAIVVVDASVPPTWGHRFTGQRYTGIHPMAVHNATDMSTIALLHGQRFKLTHRYETWVQYQSRPRRPRVALVPLARALTEIDVVRWRADAVGALTPTLSHEAESSLNATEFIEHVRYHLQTAPPAWDPAVGRRGAVDADA